LQHTPPPDFYAIHGFKISDIISAKSVYCAKHGVLRCGGVPPWSTTNCTLQLQKILDSKYPPTHISTVAFAISQTPGTLNKAAYRRRLSLMLK
jgi:hypothetical protein